MEQCQATEGCKSKRSVRKLVEGEVVDFCLVCETPIENRARRTSLTASIDRGESVPEALKSHYNKRRRAEMDNAVAIITKAQQLQELNPIELMKPENRAVISNIQDMLTTKQVSFKGSAPLKPQDVVRLGIELKQITAVGGILLRDLMLYGAKWYIGVEGWIGLIAKKAPGYTSVRENILSKEQVEELNYGYVQGVKYVKVEVLVRDHEIEEVHKANGDKVIRRIPITRVFAEAIGISGGPGERNPIVKDGHGVRMAANRGIRRLGVLMSALPQMTVDLGLAGNVGGEIMPIDDPQLEAEAQEEPQAEAPAQEKAQPQADETEGTKSGTCLNALRTKQSRRPRPKQSLKHLLKAHWKSPRNRPRRLKSLTR